MPLHRRTGYSLPTANFAARPSMPAMLLKSRPCTMAQVIAKHQWTATIARPLAGSKHEKFHRQNVALGTSVCIIASARKSVFSAGGDLRELYATAAAVSAKDRPAGVRAFLERIHAVLNVIDEAPFVPIRAG